jgi:hypothetical protein
MRRSHRWFFECFIGAASVISFRGCNVSACFSPNDLDKSRQSFENAILFRLVFVSLLAAAFTAQANNAPAAGTNVFVLATTVNKTVTFKASKILNLVSDPDGDALSVTAVDTVSTNGSPVTYNGTNVTYAPQSNYVGADRFLVTVSDPEGLSCTISVAVAVKLGNYGCVITNIFRRSDGNMGFLANGKPGATYFIQASTNPATNWLTIATDQAWTNGIIDFTDLDSTNLPGRFYRLAAP